jgi:hypothetical protein
LTGADFNTTTFGVIADFSDTAAEREHVGDRIVEALRDIEDLLEAPPTVASFDVLAPRIPVQEGQGVRPSVPAIR